MTLPSSAMRRFELSGDGRFRVSSGSRLFGQLALTASAVGSALFVLAGPPLGPPLARGALMGLVLGAGLAAWLFTGVVRTVEVGPEGLVLREVGPLKSRVRRIPPEAILGVRRGPWIARGPRRMLHRVELLLDWERLPRAFRVYASPRMLLAKRVCEEIGRGLGLTERRRPADRVVELWRVVA